MTPLFDAPLVLAGDGLDCLLRLERESGKIVGLLLEPDPWQQRARREP